MPPEPTHFQKMSDELAKHGYEWRLEKCKDKIKKLKHEYKEVVDNNNETGRKRKTFRFLRRWMLCWVIDQQRSPPAIESSAKPCSVLESDQEQGRI